MQRSNVSEMFRVYEQEYKHHTEQILYDVLKLTKTAHDEHELCVKKVNEKISEAEQCLQHMEIEAASLPANMKKEIMDTIRAYKKELQGVEKDIKKIDLEQEKIDLFSDRITSQQINQALISQEDRLSNQNLKLLEAKRTIYEADHMANNTQMNLRRQSEQMELTIQRTKEGREGLGESHVILNRMKQRIMQRRLTLYSVVAMLTFFSALIVYNWIS